MKNEIEEFNYMNDLYDIYGKLLTDKQKDVFVKYYFYDLSLQEIADEMNITKSAVLDNLEHTKNKLISYEETLNIFNKIKNFEKLDIDENVKNEILDIIRR